MKAVILAGGGGTRLWPLSTPEKPKQFQKLVGDKTMLEQTIDRLDFLKPADIYLAINRQHINLVKKLCPKIPSKNFIIEPALRDTASCIGLAAAIIQKNTPDEIMAVIYADHLIQNKKEFQTKLQKAEKIARQHDTLNIVEVEAKEPNTHYGYIKLGKQIDQDTYHLGSFKEKPDLKTAKKFLKSGNYLWNTGIYVWKASTLLKYYQKFQPKSFDIFQKIIKTGDFTPYKNLEKISIDYAIMEKIDTKNVRIIKANLGWSDIGNWEAVWKEFAKKPTDNITRGPVKLLDCSGCLVYADNNKELRAIGLKDMAIIDTPKGLLVCKKDKSRKVKDL
ncbi:mannose-1-phosphate guanylyltransferase [Candidatus Peregrinibacteria bacterium]|nr:mannose-1-phosphate guanylyltransferase [Candidatus Peregrinibacteria bacterium]